MTPEVPAADPADDAYSVLLKFLYRAPVAMVQTDSTGRVELMTPVAANYLLPLSADGDLDNLLAVLESHLPGLGARAQMPSTVDGVICSHWRFTAPDPVPRIFELDGRQVGEGLIHWVISDVTTEVLAQTAERAALVDRIERLTADLATAVDMTGIVMLRTPLPRPESPNGAADGLAGFQSLVSTEQQSAFAEDLLQAEQGSGGVIREFAVHTPRGLRWMMGRHIVDRAPGRPASLLTLCIDVTDERELARAREAQRAAEMADAVKTNFLLGVSHELRTPLNGILGLSEVLLRNGSGALAPPQREMLTRIHDSGSHLAHLVDDLLDVGAIEQGRIATSRQDVDVQAALREAMDLVQPMATARRVTLRAADDQLARFALADPTRLRQVLINLLTNAVKYNRPGGSVDLETERRGERIAISVRDTGFGMTPQQVAGLFAPFSRVGRESSAIAGMGLGLYLTKSLCEAMGGTISVDSTAQRGSTFTVDLAAGSPPTLAAAAPAAEAPVGARAVVGLLCADDNPVNLTVLESFAAERSHLRLRTVALGADFLAEARRQRPDVAVVDLELPDMTGWQVLEAMQADAALRTVPVIVWSSNSLSSAQIERLRAQGHTFLGKPVSMDAFLAEVDRLAAPAGKPP